MPGKNLLLSSDCFISLKIPGVFVLNDMHRYEGEVAGHIDSTSIFKLCDITLTNDVG